MSDVLTRRTTCYDYARRWLRSWDDIRQEDRASLMQCVLDVTQRWQEKLAPHLQPGDEVWEWQHGEHALAMAGDLAIVRDGQPVKLFVGWCS